MGKSNSKLRKKRRTRSIAWNSRFPSIASLSTRKKQPETETSDLSITRWLNVLNLNEYARVFEKFSTIDDVMNYTDRDLHDLGVKDRVHRFQMISSLIATKAKYERGSRSDGVSVKVVDKRQRHSLAVEPSMLTNRNSIECAASMAEISEPSESSIDVKMEATVCGVGSGPGPEPEDDSAEWTRSKRMLEWELSLDARDLRSHAWYHGRVSRSAAEAIVAECDGHFLVRDCSSQPANYVLTCRSKGQILHFVINKIILQPDTVYESVQYRFEEDGFDTVSDLITYYVGSGKPVTTASDAKIRTPRNREHPLSHSTIVPRRRCPSRSDSYSGGPDSVAAAAAVTAAARKPPGSNGPENTAGRDNDEDGGRKEEKERGEAVAADGEEAEALLPPPPPKPSRFARQPARNEAAHAPSGSDSGTGSGDCAVDHASSRAALRRRSSSGVVIKHPKYSAPADDADAGRGEPAVAANGGGPSPAFATSKPRLPSAFDPDNFHTLLLPVTENKPLDANALCAIHALLVESGSRILANHLTRADLRLTVANLGPDYGGCMCATGIELATLPHGWQRRADLIERTECLKLLVATTILTCDTESERAELLNKWIEVAIDAKTALGNLYGFCAIMLGLCTPQVQRLDETWHILRQKFTDSAFNFEAKLRSTLKSMNESTNPSAPNTTIPHLLPVLLLYEHAFDQITDGTRLFRPNSLYSTIEQWETSTPDLGLSTWYAHLSGSRHFGRSLPTFRRNAHIVLADSKIDELLLDLFRTEFHLKFLWGSRGAKVAAAERHLKFEEILGVMSEKCEYPDISDGYS